MCNFVSYRNLHIFILLIVIITIAQPNTYNNFQYGIDSSLNLTSNTTEYSPPEKEFATEELNLNLKSKKKIKLFSF